MEKQEQCSPLSMVEVQQSSTLIGRELQSVATPAILCHKEPAWASIDTGYLERLLFTT